MRLDTIGIYDLLSVVCIGFNDEFLSVFYSVAGLYLSWCGGICYPESRFNLLLDDTYYLILEASLEF